MTATLPMADENNVADLFSKPDARFVTVNPETARRWLALNHKNRNLRKADLDRYTRDMLAGNWHLAGDPIRFATDGTLLDGQHRLAAIIEAGVTLPLLVVRGVRPEAQSVMDTGRRRTAADALAINGKLNAPVLAAVALLLLSHQRGYLDGHPYEASHEEIIECIDAHPGLVDAVTFTKALARRTDCPPSVVAYSYYLMAQASAADAAAFWVAASDKVGLSDGDPVIALTNRFAEARRNRERLTKRIYLSLILRAWNARRQGKTMRLLRVNSPKGGLVPIPAAR